MGNDFVIFLGTLPWVFFLLYIYVIHRSKISENAKLKRLYVFVLIFASLRYGIGYDYYTYKGVIEGIAPEYKFEALEPIPKLISLLFGRIHYQMFFVVMSFLTIYPIYWVCRRLSACPSESFILFLLYPQFFLESLSTVRNSLAYALVVVMFFFLYREKYLKSAIFLVLAFFSHTSAIVAIILYPVYFFFKSRIFNILLYLLSFALSLFIIPILTTVFGDIVKYGKFSYYIDNADLYSGGAMMTILLNALGIFNLLYWKRLSVFNELNSKLLPIVNVGICMWNIFAPISPVFATRFTVIFIYLLIFLIPSYSLALKKVNPLVNRHNVHVVFVLLFVFTFAIQYINYYKGGHMSNVPYQFFFLHTDEFAVNSFE